MKHPKAYMIIVDDGLVIIIPSGVVEEGPGRDKEAPRTASSKFTLSFEAENCMV
jgi:hypothetical protein